MSIYGKVSKFYKENFVLIAGAGLIIGIHWMWYRIQNVPRFVSDAERKEMPLFRAFHYMKDKFTHTSSGVEEATEEIKVKTSQN